MALAPPVGARWVPLDTRDRWYTKEESCPLGGAPLGRRQSAHQELRGAGLNCCVAETKLWSNRLFWDEFPRREDEYGLMTSGHNVNNFPALVNKKQRQKYFAIW